MTTKIQPGELHHTSGVTAELQTLIDNSIVISSAVDQAAALAADAAHVAAADPHSQYLLETQTATAGSLAVTDTFFVAQGGVTKKMTFQTLLDLISGYGATGEVFDWYVDSVNGSDSANGLTYATALQTLAALQSKTITDGQKIGLKRGSTWREQLTITVDNVSVKAYGTGANPRLKAKDIIPAAGFTKTLGQTNVYQATIAVTAGWTSVWEDTVRLARVDDVATCDSTAGSYTCTDAAGNMTLYVHASDDSNPATSGMVYEATTRAAGIWAPTASGVTVVGITCEGNRSDSGMFVMGQYTTLTNCIALEGTKHNYYVGGNSVLTDCDAQDAYYGAGAGGGKSYFVYNQDTSANQPVTYIRCRAINTGAYDGYATGFYGHTNVSGTFGTVTYHDCSVTGLTVAFDAVATTLMVLDGCTADGCRELAMINVDTNINGGSFVNGPALSAAVYCESAADKTVNISGLSIGEAAGWMGAAIYAIPKITINLTDSSILIPTTGMCVKLDGDESVLNASGNHYSANAGWFYYWLVGPAATLVSDNNNFLIADPNFSINGTEYLNLALYQAGTGQDAHSTVG